MEAAPGSDHRGFAELSARIPHIELTTFTDVWVHGMPLGSQQVWISSRFHHHVFGSLAGARGIALASGGEYYGTKHASGVSAGSNWTVVDPLRDALPPPAELQRPAYAGSPHILKQREAATIYGV